MGLRVIKTVEYDIVDYFIEILENFKFSNNFWEQIAINRHKGYFVTPLQKKDRVLDGLRDRLKYGLSEDNGFRKLIKFNKTFGDSLAYDSLLSKQNRDIESIEQLKTMSLRRGISQYEMAIVTGRLANRYSNLNRLKEAEKSYEELLELYRELAEENPTVYNSDVAMTLTNLAFLYADDGRLEEAKEAYDEALILQMKLVKIDSIRYGLDYANTVVFAFYSIGKYRDSLDGAEEILRGYIGVPRAEKLLKFIEELRSL